ncbi:hypothetical protein CL614_08965 [archaeon]|nr:hypothetical protein [archaeon]|tara:strand:- start:615 stop:1253 length:639 start_codon:yes stop_codon:yes gene_type:complete
MSNSTHEWIDIYKKESSDVFNNLSTDEIVRFTNIILDAYDREATIFACGNGGNVAAVQNMVVDLNMHPFVSEDKGRLKGGRNKFHAVSLCSCSATITGISNDLGYEHIFSEQLKYQARSGDVLFCMTGSGNSKNVIKAAALAKEAGLIVVSITRGMDSYCEAVSDLVIHVKGTSVFPGQTGKNNNNFHFEDCISKVVHTAVGLLKERVQNGD